ncbi:MAG: TolC family protein [Acidobacteriota bacterium]
MVSTRGMMIALAVPALFAVAPAEALTIEPGESLSVRRCVEIALATHPELQVFRSAVDYAAARVGEAKAGYYPSIDLSAGYRKDQAVDIHSRNPAGLPYSTIKDGDDKSASIILQQTLYDFGKTSGSVRVEELGLDSSRLDYDSAADSITFRARVAYYDVLRALSVRDANADTVRAYEKHLQQARDFFEAGTKPRYDVTKAELDLSDERLKLIESENSVKLAWIALNNAMGIGSSAEYALVDGLDFVKYDVMLDAAMQHALEHRPDLLSLIARQKAAQASVSLAKTGFYPAFSALGAYRFDGIEFPLDNGWSLGLTMSVNLFSGFATSRRVDQAVAVLSAERSRIDSLRLEIRREIEQSFLNLQLAEEAIANAEVQVRLATENLDLANRRYEAGVGDPVEVSDAIASMSRANVVRARALHGYKVVQAVIEKAMAKR